MSGSSQSGRFFFPNIYSKVSSITYARSLEPLQRIGFPITNRCPPLVHWGWASLDSNWIAHLLSYNETWTGSWAMDIKTRRSITDADAVPWTPGPLTTHGRSHECKWCGGQESQQSRHSHTSLPTFLPAKNCEDRLSCCSLDDITHLKAFSRETGHGRIVT